VLLGVVVKLLGVATRLPGVVVKLLGLVDVTPNTSLPGSSEITTLLGGLAQWAIYASIGALLIGAVTWGFASRTGNFDHAHRGRNLLLGGVAGAVLAGAVSTIIDFAFSAGRAVH
jgi:hypothetical protein